MNTNATNKNISGRKVFVGLSGGVDSAVSAALLKKQGFNVTGVFIKVWSPDFLPCSWREERRDAMRVAAKLDIPFLFFDFSSEYKKGVVDTMIEEYKKGNTPNPDVICNREIKFGAFWQKSKELGATYIATGHYAHTDNKFLYEGADTVKDQSYFLWTLTKEDLSHTLFPIGHLDKSEVRVLAKKYHLPVSEKKDSQGICFIGDVSMDEFLKELVESNPGEVKNSKGETIGTHEGAIHYTMGERHGFDIQKKEVNEKPYYVVSKDMETNTITVSSNELEIKSLTPTRVKLDKMNWLGNDFGNVEARVRYRQERFPIEIGDEQVTFSKPQTVAVGQSVVFYKNNECLGGGIVKEVLI